MGALATFLQRGKNPVYDNHGFQVIKSGQARGGVNFDFSKTYYASNYDEDDNRILKRGDILINSTGVGTAGRVTLFDLDGKFVVDNHITIMRLSADVNNLYVFYVLAYGIGFKNIEAMASGTSGQIELSIRSIENITIPLPPMDIQKKIAEECAEIDHKMSMCLGVINQSKDKLSNIVNSMIGEKTKLSSICEINSQTINPSQDGKKEFVYIDIDSVENGTGCFSLSKIITGKNAPSRARRYAVSGSTIISTVRPNLRGFAYIEKEIPNSVYSTGFAVLKSKNETVLANKMIYYQFMYSDLMMQQMVAAMPKGSYPSINKDNIENFNILVSVKNQDLILGQLDECERESKDAAEYVKKAPSLKQAILDKYLK